MKRLFRITLFILTACAVTLFACSNGGSAPASSACGKRVCIDLNASSPLILDQPVQVTVTVTSTQDIPKAHISIEPSDEIWVHAAGPTAWDVDLQASQPVSLTATLTFTHESLYLIDGYVRTVDLNEVNSINILFNGNTGVLNPPPAPNPRIPSSAPRSASVSPLPSGGHPESRKATVDASPNLPIPDDGSWLTYPMPISTAPASATVVGTSVAFYINHPRPQELVVELVAPDVQVVRVWDRQVPTQKDYASKGPNQGQLLVTPPSNAFNGQLVNGTWIIRVRDEAPGQAGTLTSFSFSVAWMIMVPDTRPTNPAPSTNQPAPHADAGASYPSTA